jgi:hypothetical protein
MSWEHVLVTRLCQLVQNICKTAKPTQQSTYWIACHEECTENKVNEGRSCCCRCCFCCLLQIVLAISNYRDELDGPAVSEGSAAVS